MKEYEELTKRNIISKLFWYAIPLILGNIVLLSYDLVDSVVISKFVGEVGLAAVSNAGQISSLILLFFYGLCIGASVIISEFYGAKNYKKLRVEVTTTLLAGSIFTIAISICLAVFSKKIFLLMKVPEEVIGEAMIYLQIASVGLPFVFVYNVFANTMRAMGNSKIPTFFLALSAVINIILDLYFVAILNFGVAGASAATVIAQISTCFIMYVYVQIKIKELRFKIRDYVIDVELLYRTFKDGIITAVQQAVPPFGRTLVITKINTLGVIAMAADGIISRIDSFAIMPAQNISVGIMTYVAQSRGAKKSNLIKEIFYKGMLLEMIFAFILFIVLSFFKNSIMVGLSPKGSIGVITLGEGYLEIISFGYFLVGIINSFQSLFRGMANMSLTLYSSLMNIVVRVFVVYMFIEKLGFNVIAWATISGWIVMIIYGYIMYKRYCKTKWKDIITTQKRDIML